ncbi:MAG TPA: flagellar hook-basal body complex protein FliE [Bryobacteraceae bacterium]|nr:flagellar hook-basal body complex protein FliE [Bryobacteraceae bacterium]
MPAEIAGAGIQTPGTTKGSGEFRDLMQGAIQKVEQTGNEATKAVEGFLAGDGQELHTAILATQRADLAFELGLQVRNKVVSAYQEIMRMQM